LNLILLKHKALPLELAFSVTATSVLKYPITQNSENHNGGDEGLFLFQDKFMQQWGTYSC
jgi:hypothetical protein